MASSAAQALGDRVALVDVSDELGGYFQSWRYIQRGKLDAVKLWGRWWVTPDSVEQARAARARRTAHRAGAL